MLRRVLLTDSDVYPQYCAAHALANRLTAENPDDTETPPDIVNVLRKAGTSDNPYIRKAAGSALSNLGFRDGVKLLIDYLGYRALDTSSDNYGSNMGAVLLEITNMDFKRDQTAWLEWFAARGDTFSIGANLKARKAYYEAKNHRSDGNSELAEASYKTALTSNPEYLAARRDYALWLNQRAWNMVTGPDTNRDPDQALTWAEQAVELDEQPDYLDTLAEVWFQKGNRSAAIKFQSKAVKAAPDNAELKQRLERFKSDRLPG